MQTSSQTPQERNLQHPLSDAQQYNYEHFFPALLMKDAKLLRHPGGPHPGDAAPDFTLQDTEGSEWRLQDLRDRSVVLLIGSGTCPITEGGLPGLQSLFEEYKDRCQWLMLYVREAHPGENLQAHNSYEQKRGQADYFRQATNTQWPVLVDDLEGSIHKEYGLLPNSVFLIDADGRVAFVGEISHAPTLRRALNQLFAQNMRGAVAEGEDKKLHMLGPTAYGWAAIERAGRISKRDIMKKMPPLAVNLWIGSKMKFLLKPIAKRSAPLPTAAKVGLGAAAGLALWGLLRMLRR